jgi:hypothetical protein
VVIVLASEIGNPPDSKVTRAFFDKLLPNFKGKFSAYFSAKKFINFRLKRGLEPDVFAEWLNACKKDISSFFSRNCRVVCPRRKHASITLLLSQGTSLAALKRLIFVSLLIPTDNLYEMFYYANEDGLTGVVVLEYYHIPMFFVKAAARNGDNTLPYVGGDIRWFMTFHGTRGYYVDSCRGCNLNGHIREECKYDRETKTFSVGSILKVWTNVDEIPFRVIKQVKQWAFEDDEVIPPFTANLFANERVLTLKYLPNEMFLNPENTEDGFSVFDGDAKMEVEVELDFETMSKSFMSSNAATTSPTVPNSNISPSSNSSNDHDDRKGSESHTHQVVPASKDEKISIAWATSIVIGGEPQVKLWKNLSPVQMELICFMWTGDHSIKTFDMILQDCFQRSYVSQRSSFLTQWMADRESEFGKWTTGEFNRLCDIREADIKAPNISMEEYYDIFDKPVNELRNTHSTQSVNKKRKILTGNEKFVDLVDSPVLSSSPAVNFEDAPFSPHSCSEHSEPQ